MLYVYALVFGGIVGFLIYLLNEIRIQAFAYDFWADASDAEIAIRRMERKYEGPQRRAQEMLNRASAQSREVRQSMKVWDDVHLHESLNEMMRFSWPKKTEVVIKPREMRQLIAA